MLRGARPARVGVTLDAQPHRGRDSQDVAISSSRPKLRGRMVALLVSKKIFCLSSIFSCVTTMCWYFFGQPSLSAGPGSFGHLSSASRTPSLSLSGSGQPSSSSKPSLSSGSFGHLSPWRRRCRPCRCRGRGSRRRPGSRPCPRARAGTCRRVGDAVLVVVGIGAAVVVLEAVLVLGLGRALVDGVGDAVTVGVARHRRRRALSRGDSDRPRARSPRRSAGARGPGSNRPRRARDRRTRGASRRARARAARTCRRRCRAPPSRWPAPGARSAGAGVPAQPGRGGQDAIGGPEERGAERRRPDQEGAPAATPERRAIFGASRGSAGDRARLLARPRCGARRLRWLLRHRSSEIARARLARSSARCPNSMASSYSA